jgi:hypothetical protein
MWHMVDVSTSPLMGLGDFAEAATAVVKPATDAVVEVIAPAVSAVSNVATDLEKGWCFNV